MIGRTGSADHADFKTQMDRKPPRTKPLPIEVDRDPRPRAVKPVIRAKRRSSGPAYHRHRG